MLINNKAQEKFSPDREVIHQSKAVEHLRGLQTEKRENVYQNTNECQFCWEQFLIIIQKMN